RIERSNMALGDERNAQPEPIAPERQPALMECARQLALERPIHPVRVAADRLVTDEPAAHDRTDQDEGKDQGALATHCLRNHGTLGMPIELNPDHPSVLPQVDRAGVRIRCRTRGPEDKGLPPLGTAQSCERERSDRSAEGIERTVNTDGLFFKNMNSSASR